MSLRKTEKSRIGLFKIGLNCDMQIGIWVVIIQNLGYPKWHASPDYD